MIHLMETIHEIIKLTSSAGTLPQETGVPGLVMIRGQVPNHQLAALYRPMIGFTVQGTKKMLIGDHETVMKGPSYFVLPMHVPASATVHPAANGGAYTSLGLDIDQEILQSLLRDLSGGLSNDAAQPFSACEMSPEMAEAWLRLLRLSKNPTDAAALAPAFKREIYYRVLMGPQGQQLRRLASQESTFSKISSIVQWLRDKYMHPLDIKVVAKKSGMALNTFHRQFKRATGLSPIQFQKQLRLLEARNLISIEGYSVSSAAYEVGYQSPSQFNREYSRFFGASPAKDAKKLAAT